MRDAEVVLRGEGQVLPDIALRIDDRGDMRLLVTDQIRGMREAIEIELFQKHCRDDASTRSRVAQGLDRLPSY